MTRILVSGGAVVLRNGRVRREVGLVDAKTVAMANKLGIDIAAGSISKSHEHVLIFVRDKFSGAHKSGFALRSRVVWWLNTGEVIIGGKYDIHHKFGNKIDDRFDQLEKLTHKEHLHHHNPKGLKRINCVCQHCGNTFQIEGWRSKETGRGKFCSQPCYQNYPKSNESSEKRSRTLKQKYAEGWRAR